MAVSQARRGWRQQVERHHVGRVGGIGVEGRSMASLAFSCVSVSPKRARTLFWSANRPVVGDAGRLQDLLDAFLASSLASTLTVALPLETCTAGHLAVEVRQGVDQAPQQDEADQEVFQSG
jgi:hypothetical protein